MRFLEDALKDKCLSCDVCCRFPEKYSQLIPFFLHDEITDEKYFPQIGKTYGCRINLADYGDIYSCPYFQGSKNSCSIYKMRPLDCKLYPFMITYDEDYAKVILVLDNNCPGAKELMKYRDKAKEFIESIKLGLRDIGFINNSQSDTIFVNELPELTDFIFGKTGRFRKLKLEDGHVTAYLWKDIMNILYEEDTGEAYYNFKRFPKEDKDYIYLKQDLVELKGDKYKDKRNLCNYFQKNYGYKIESLVPNTEIIEKCLALYKTWSEKKTKSVKTEYEKQLMEDSFFFHRRALFDFNNLGLIGIKIEIDSKLAAYTFGCRLNRNTFCMLGEIADLEYKGINQFIFREFCRTIHGNYLYVNTMDDSDLEGLRKNKISYRPLNIL